VIDDCGELQNITTDGIADFDARGGAGELTSVSGMLEMVKQGVAEHGEKYSSERLIFTPNSNL
jgi:hypothetical protein